MARSPRWRRCSPPRLPRRTPGRRSSWASPRRSAPASPWPSPRRCRTTAASPAAARPCSAARSPGLMTTLGGIGHTLPFLIPAFWTAMVVADLRGGGRAWRDQLGAVEIHGHAAALRDVAGRLWRRAGVRVRDTDRQQLGIARWPRPSSVNLPPRRAFATHQPRSCCTGLPRCWWCCFGRSARPSISRRAGRCVSTIARCT